MDFSLQKQPRKLEIMSPDLVLEAAFDRGNVNSRHAMYIISVTLKSARFDIKTVIVSFNTIHRKRAFHVTEIELEKLLERKLIWFPCHHYIWEIVLKGVFKVFWPTQSGPNVQIFTRFKNSWDKITLDNSKWQSGMTDAVVAITIEDNAVDLLVFFKSYLQMKYNFSYDLGVFVKFQNRL
ncbi:Protein of unknown function [Cotesia congregata]|uniref:Uncharacterized protein n=1 Tax=Cotesia congregata TaxID=51543 RepID=A0A8J2MPJ0_COTCN|nr:Protein of unknown function [Cotesia congregata]